MVLNPRRAASRTTPAPVEPPPITRTSASSELTDASSPCRLDATMPAQPVARAWSTWSSSPARPRGAGLPLGPRRSPLSLRRAPDDARSPPARCQSCLRAYAFAPPGLRRSPLSLRRALDDARSPPARWRRFPRGCARPRAPGRRGPGCRPRCPPSWPSFHRGSCPVPLSVAVRSAIRFGCGLLGKPGRRRTMRRRRVPFRRESWIYNTRVRSASLHPVEGAGDRLLPERVLTGDVGLVHARGPLLVLAPVLAQVLHLRPEADGQAGCVGGAERCRLSNGRSHHGHAENVRLELHQGLVVDHAAVHLERGQRDPGVGVHGVDDLTRLPRRRLERRPCDVTLVDVAR